MLLIVSVVGESCTGDLSASSSRRNIVQALGGSDIDSPPEVCL